MPDYLVDFYSPEGKLFRSERLFARDDAESENAAKQLATLIRPATYRIINLAQYADLPPQPPPKGQRK